MNKVAKDNKEVKDKKVNMVIINIHDDIIIIIIIIGTIIMKMNNVKQNKTKKINTLTTKLNAILYFQKINEK